MADAGIIRVAYLVLLPAPPLTVSANAVSTIYESLLVEVLKHLSEGLKKTTVGCILDIALSVPHLTENSSPTRCAAYQEVQRLVAAVYRLICTIAAKNNYNVEDAEGIDTRILLVASSSQHNQSDQENDRRNQAESAIPSLDVVAHSGRLWQRVFTVDGEGGEQILRQFLICYDKHIEIQKVPFETDPSVGDAHGQLVGKNGGQQRQYHSVAVGGTFDHIHIGHKLLLTMSAFLLSEPGETHEDQCILTIGITGDEMLKNKKHADLLQSWSERQRLVADFLCGILDFRSPADAKVISVQQEPQANGHIVSIRLRPKFVIRCVEINDAFGPTITDRNISALVISGETRAGGKAVNDKRAEKEWPALDVFEVDVLDVSDADSCNPQMEEKFENKLSSTKIREAISKKGRARSKV